MKFSFVGKPDVVTEKLKIRTEEKMSKLKKFLPQDTELTVAFKVTKLENRIEVTIPAYKRVLRAEVKGDDMYNTLDDAVEVLEKQLRRLKTRIQDKTRKEKIFKEESGNMEEEIQDQEPIITRFKYPVKPMDLEDAIMEMELLSHSFHVYRNISTDEINVIYKRNAENSYGIIEP